MIGSIGNGLIDHPQHGQGIGTHENGRAPQDFPADWYSPEQYHRAATMALGLVEA